MADQHTLWDIATPQTAADVLLTVCGHAAWFEAAQRPNQALDGGHLNDKTFWLAVLAELGGAGHA